MLKTRIDNLSLAILQTACKQFGCKGKLRMRSIHLFGDHVERLKKNLDKWWKEFSTPDEYESSGEFVDEMGVAIGL